MDHAPRLCIVSPNRHAWSETFIANHIAGLPNVCLVLTDGHLPRCDADGRSLVDPGLAQRAIGRLIGRTPTDLLRTRITKRLRQERIDVVLAEYGPTGDAMREICTSLNIPLVTHFHGIDAFHTKLLKDHGNYAALFRDAHALVAVSREMEQQLLQLGAPREKVHYNCYGIDTGRFTSTNPSSNPAHFLAVGRFVEKKAPELTLTAFHSAWQQRNSMRLTMAGQGPLWESTQRMASAWGLADVVSFPGVLTQEQVAAHMHRSRAFVQHSVITRENDHEGTPLSILEAMATGLPVIATRHGGIPDVVEHGVSGLLCEEGDVDTMAKHMLTLADDPGKAAQLGAAGHARVQRDHQLAGSLTALNSILVATATR